MHPEASKVNLRSFFIFRGDIVIAKSPFDPDMNICKRVIGLEGDKVCTSGPSDLFKTHTYVSTGTTRQAICISAVYLHFFAKCIKFSRFAKCSTL